MYVPELSPTSMFLSVVRCFSPVVGDLETLTLQARSTKRNGAPQRRFGKACQGLLLKSPAVGRSWNHLKMVVDLRYQDTPRLHGLIWTYIGIYRIIAQDSTLNWMVYEIINDYHFLLSECSFAGASKNTQMVQRGSLAPRRMSGTFANICAMSSLGMPSIYIDICTGMCTVTPDPTPYSNTNFSRVWKNQIPRIASDRNLALIPHVHSAAVTKTRRLSFHRKSW
jgi:hypothetical protein